AALLPNVEELLNDPSPLVRAMAVWALSRLAPERAKAMALTNVQRETDSSVREEWNRA
ncbi:MAG: HEAT repeat domain-containing protein, partial [Proteobacteria bacterium]|nr:HEAT repeat domain-containing protein [Pseudomonadota bacterium]